jgi:hypothetical protein
MWFLLFFCLLLSACSETTSLPEGVLPQDKMATVFYDVIKADEMVDLLKYSDSTYHLFSKRTALYDTIFQIHGIEKQIFQKSLSFYQRRPDLLREVVDNMHSMVNDTTSTRRNLPKRVD